MKTISEEVRNVKSQPRDLSGRLVLGARSIGGGWFASSHEVTNMNIFSSILSLDRMKNMTKAGSCKEEGDYLAWRDMNWVLHGQARIGEIEKEKPCHLEPYVDLYNTEFPSMSSCMHHCQNLGTRAPSVATSQLWLSLQQSLKAEVFDKNLNALMMWLPLEDAKLDNHWRDFHTSSLIENYTQPWAGDNPFRCAFLLDENSWGNQFCEWPHYACMCKHEPQEYLEFRGLCPTSQVDRFYKPINGLTDSMKLGIQGLKQTLITYNEDEEVWILNVPDTNVTGRSTAVHASFTLGKHNWTIEGDKGCNRGEEYVTELKMSGCQDGYFTCNDGQCVIMDLRCNQMPDCRDKSDERNCNILVLEEGYNKRVPPIQDIHKKLNVSVSIELLRLVDINEEDYSIAIQFEISLMWKDNRATFHNLKESDSLNALSQEDIERLWLPKVIYENTDQKETTRLGEFGNGEWETNVIVKREESNGTLSGFDYVDETEIFSGSENSLMMNQTYTHSFQCNFRLSDYPFDCQV